MYILICVIFYFEILFIWNILVCGSTKTYTINNKKLFIKVIFFKECMSLDRYLCIWMFCLSVCVCVPCVTGLCSSQRRALDPLELEFLMAVGYHMGDRN